MAAGPRDAGAGLTLAAALLLAGCSGSGGNEPTTASSTTDVSPSGESSAATAGKAVIAVEKEYSIALSESSLSPGTYTFAVENRGELPHDLTIRGPGVDGQASPMLQGGQAGEVTVTLQEGSYELWCSVGGHRGQGMDETIQVG